MAEEVPGFCSLCVSNCGCVNVVEDGELREDLAPGVAVSSWGWWQPCPELGLEGHGDGWNYNALFDHRPHDPVSGSFPLREGVCDVEPADE